VLFSEGLQEGLVKGALNKLQNQRQISITEQAAKLDTEDSVAKEIAAAQAAHAAAGSPPEAFRYAYL
jgi:hypothetical protein